MPKKKTEKNTGSENPNSEVINTISEISVESKYVVVRDGLRVSDKEYSSPTDPEAISEKLFWKKVVDRYPDGTKVSIVPFDKKKHRVW